MQVLAIDLMKRIDKENAWLAPNKKYYTSEEVYHKLKRKKQNAAYRKKKKREKKQMEKAEEEQKRQQKKADRELRQKQKAIKEKLKETELCFNKACIKRMFDWMEYPTNGYMPPLFFRRLKEWYKNYNFSYEVILETMDMIDNDVRFIMKTKNFDNDFGKVKYICAMIANNLNQGLKSFNEKQKAINESSQNDNAPTDVDISMPWVETKADESGKASRSLLNSLLKDIGI